MMGLIVWSVFCLGLALMAGTAGEAKTAYEWFGNKIASIGGGCIVWSIGLGLWYFSGYVAGVTP